MANVIKKHSISSELAQKNGGCGGGESQSNWGGENVAILDDGGNLKAFGRMDGAPILCIEIAQEQGLHRFVWRLHARPLQVYPSRPIAFSRHAHACARGGVGGGFPIKVDGENCRRDRLSGAPTVQNDVDCAMAALALVPDAMPAD